MRPAVSISFCLPVKKGWQAEQISVKISPPFFVERVSKLLPQWHLTGRRFVFGMDAFFHC